MQLTEFIEAARVLSDHIIMTLDVDLKTDNNPTADEVLQITKDFACLISDALKLELFKFRPTEPDGCYGNVVLPHTNIITGFKFSDLDNYAAGLRRPVNISMKFLVKNLQAEAEAKIALG